MSRPLQRIDANPRGLTLAEARERLARAQANNKRWPRNLGFYWDVRYYRRLVNSLEAEQAAHPSPNPAP